MPQSRHTAQTPPGPDTRAGAPVCAYCGQPFLPRQKNQRFCPGGRCKSAFYAERDAAARDLTRRVDGKNPAAVALGRLGGIASGRARRAKAQQRENTNGQPAAK